MTGIIAKYLYMLNHAYMHVLVIQLLKKYTLKSKVYKKH